MAVCCLAVQIVLHRDGQAAADVAQQRQARHRHHQLARKGGEHAGDRRAEQAITT